MKEFNLYARVEKLAPEIIAEEKKIYKGVSANIDFYSGFAYSMLGLPLELYFFSQGTEWIPYEHLQSEIFEHVFAVLPIFGLRVFQSPMGIDFSGGEFGGER